MQFAFRFFFVILQPKRANNLSIDTNFEQQDETFKIMKIEKLIAYIFLTFILIVACFNIIGSLSMLISRTLFLTAPLKLTITTLTLL